MIESKIREVLNQLDFKESNQLTYKIIPSDLAAQLNFTKDIAKIKLNDSMLKGSFTQPGDVIAIYRDYELNVSPYYYYRLVEL